MGRVYQGPTQATGLGPDAPEWWNYAIRADYRQVRWHLEHAKYWLARLQHECQMPRPRKRVYARIIAIIFDHFTSAMFYRELARANRKTRNLRFQAQG